MDVRTPISDINREILGKYAQDIYKNHLFPPSSKNARKVVFG